MAILAVQQQAGDGVAVVTIDHPPTNSLVPDFYAELDECITELDADDEVRAVVFGSANTRIFAAGADLNSLRENGLSLSAVLARVDRAHAAFTRLQRLGKPTVAAIQGHALGGGCELALAMDFRFMTKGRARIGLPEASLGLIPAAGGTQRLARLIGRGRATELLMLARRLDADEAARAGVVTRACDDARAAALEYAAELATIPASSLRAIKACLNEGVDGDLVRGLAVERTLAGETFADSDAAEGIAAFLEGRRPRFHPAAKGRKQ